MARKRDRYTRARDRRRRPQTPAPTDGFLIRDVARLTAVPVRTLRDYVQRGLLRHSELRGTLTRYPRREVLRLLVALRLKADTKATLAEIKHKLDALGEAELHATLGEAALAPAVATELGITSHAPGATARPELPGLPALECTSAYWHRIPLLPGLELLLSAGASPTVTDAALRIVREHADRY